MCQHACVCSLMCNWLRVQVGAFMMYFINQGSQKHHKWSCLSIININCSNWEIQTNTDSFRIPQLSSLEPGKCREPFSSSWSMPRMVLLLSCPSSVSHCSVLGCVSVSNQLFHENCPHLSYTHLRSRWRPEKNLDREGNLERDVQGNCLMSDKYAPWTIGRSTAERGTKRNPSKPGVQCSLPDFWAGNLCISPCNWEQFRAHCLLYYSIYWNWRTNSNLNSVQNLRACISYLVSSRCAETCTCMLHIHFKPFNDFPLHLWDQTFTGNSHYSCELFSMKSLGPLTLTTNIRAFIPASLWSYFHQLT